MPRARARARRTHLRLGLGLVTLAAVLSTSYLVLWAGGESLRLQRQSTVVALATAAASSAAAVLDVHQPLGQDPNRVRLQGLARDLVQQNQIAQVSFTTRNAREVASFPQRAPDDADTAILVNVLSGAPPTYIYG